MEAFMEPLLVAKTRKRLLKTLAVLCITVAIANQIASYFYWYFSIWWFDMPMHLLGGMSLGLVALLGFFAQKAKNQAQIPNKKELLTIILLTALSIGFTWEIFEIVLNHYTTQFQFNLLDTLSDISFDMAGAVLTYFIFLKRYKDSYREE